jgi:hypothetical protein
MGFFLTAIYCLGVFIGLFMLFALLCSIVAIGQEKRIWEPESLPSLSFFGKTKVLLFNVLWMAGCGVGSFLMVSKKILTAGNSNLQGDINVTVEKTVALTVIRLLLGEVKLIGKENLPSDPNQTPAPIYIANHASQIDIGVSYHVMAGRRFKWIAKQSVVSLPPPLLTAKFV